MGIFQKSTRYHGNRPELKEELEMYKVKAQAI